MVKTLGRLGRRGERKYKVARKDRGKGSTKWLGRTREGKYKVARKDGGREVQSG